jgi:putative endonuclease
MLQCSDNTYYTGCTNNITKRLLLHNSAKSGAKYTRMRQPVTLLYSETYLTYSEARFREGEIKRLSRKEKEVLVEIKK